MSLTFNRDPLGNMPSYVDHWQKELLGEYERKIASVIRNKCESCGWEYIPDRIKKVIDMIGNELYYYQLDDGMLMPLIALSPTGQKWSGNGLNEGIKVTLECVKLDPSVFIPRS